MSLRSTLKALPTMMRIGVSEAIAYRAEMFIWVLATTMPFIMLVMWTAVAEYAPVVGKSGKSYGTEAFTSYFLSVFVVRQLISAWASWEMNFEVRQGTLAMRLLRPMHPIVSYAVNNLAALPLRFLVTMPVVITMIILGTTRDMPSDWRIWALFLLSMLGGWLITFFANIAVGTMSLFMESSIKVMDVWLAAFFVFSGYLFPMDLFPPALRAVAEWLPFRYQIGLPVELLTNAHTFDEALPLLARQFGWGFGFFLISVALWNRGMKRFQAFGG